MGEIRGARRKAWRCFHCDEVFRSVKCAAIHFGNGLDAEPACKLARHTEHLITYIRELEAEVEHYRREDSHVLQAIRTLEGEQSQALRREEEKGFQRGVEDSRNYFRENPTALRTGGEHD